MTKAIILCPFLFLVASSPVLAGEFATVDKPPYFDITVPEGFRFTKLEPPGIDFELYALRKGDEPYVVVYVGNAPGFPQLKALPSQQLVMTRTPKMQIASLWDHGEVVDIEFLIETVGSRSWPRYIHASSSNKPDVRKVAQQLLLSLSVDESKWPLD